MRSLCKIYQQFKIFYSHKGCIRRQARVLDVFSRPGICFDVKNVIDSCKCSIISRIIYFICVNEVY